MKITGRIYELYREKTQAACLLAVEAGKNRIRAAAVSRRDCSLIFTETYEGPGTETKLKVKLQKWQAVLEDAETVFVLPPDAAASCSFTLPPMADGEKEQAVKWEIMQRLGWDEENNYYGWVIYGSRAEAASVPRSAADSLLAAAGNFKKAGIAAPWPVCTDEEIANIKRKENFFADGKDMETAAEYRACLDAALGQALGRRLLYVRTAGRAKGAGSGAALKLCLPLAAAAAAAVFFCAVWTAAEWHREKGRLASLNAQLAAEAVWQQRYEEAARTEKEIRSLTEKLAAIRRSRPDWAAAADGLGRLTPEGCWLERLEFGGSKGMLLQGGALSEADLKKMRDNIRESGLYGREELLETSGRQAAGTEYIHFAMRLQPVKGGEHE